MNASTQTRRQTTTKSGLRTGKTLLLPAPAEAAFFGLLSLATASVQVFILSPNMTLLFDSQGYLAMASALQNLQGIDLGSIIAACSCQSARQALAQHLAPVADIVKSGPVVPAILAAGYAITGKAIGTANWPVAALSMLTLYWLTAGAAYLTARRLWGVAQARLAGLLFMLYPGFLVNAGRPLSEVPALAIETFAFLFLYILLVPERKLNGQAPQDTVKGGKSGWTAPALGLATGLLMLARPTLLPLPALLGLAIAAAARFTGARKVLSLKTLAVALSAALLVLGSWALAKFVLTGQPSITVDRHGPWNLYAGAAIKSDGWDVLPSEFVSHPEQFKLTMGEAARQVISQAAGSPVDALSLAARKPARLAGAPWNDFQVSVLGMPWLVQRFIHQFLLMAAFFGFQQLLETGLARRQAAQLSNRRLAAGPVAEAGIATPALAEILVAATLGLTVLYHLVSCCFITMSRYFFTAMSPVILLASFGLVSAWRQNPARRPLVFISLLLVPLASLVLEWLTGSGGIILTELSRMNGQSTVAALCATLLAVSVTVALHLLSEFRKGWTAALTAVFIAAAGITTFSACHRTISTAPTLISLLPGREKSFECLVSPQDLTAEKLLYLVLDKPRAEGSSGKQEWMTNLNVRVNDQPIAPDWRPLFAVDAGQRENITYLTVFAYSSGKEVGDFQQWMCVPVKAELLQPGINKVTLTAAAPLELNADLADAGGDRIHSLSLRNFSWSKGFFADSPGEARMDRWDVDNQARSRPSLLPRLMLLAVSPAKPAGRAAGLTAHPGSRLDAGAPRFDASVGATPCVAQEITLADQTIGKSISERVKEVTVTADQLALDVPENSNFALRLKLTAAVSSSSKTTSVGFIETLRSGDKVSEEFAPLAPIASGNGSLTIDETVPLSQQGSRRKLEKIRLVFSGHRWWDVLGYGNFKAQGSAFFKNLKLTAKVEPLVNLDTDSWRTIAFREAKPAIATRHLGAIGE